MSLARRTVLRLAAMQALAGPARSDPGAAQPAASVPLDLSSGPCVVGVLIEGRPARLVLDTGAERTILTRAAVARHGLRLDEWVGTALRGAGGQIDEHQNAVVGSVTLGGTTLYGRDARAPLSLPVTALDLGGLDGLLGGDLLRRHTLDVDLAAHTLTLRDPATAMPAASVTLAMLRGVLPLAPVELDGHKLTALVDTGAGVSLVNARGLFRLGLDARGLQADPTVSSLGIGGAFAARRHVFRSLRLGPLRRDRPGLLTLARPEPAFDMVLGLDLLAGQRMLLSYGKAFLKLSA